jgi:hypothetical protein
MNSGEKVEFTPPKNFIPPNDGNGEDFSLVCTFSVRGGKLCMTKLGETEMPGYGKDDMPQSKPDYSAMTQGMQQQMGGMQ